MSKLLNTVLDKVSEDNNSYRMELRNLNKNIDEKTTALVGDVVTFSNYTIDFSNALMTAKEKLVNPISRIIENYVIKDLRGVEAVNEQFVDKINDKIEGTNITNTEEKNNFIGNLDNLLKDKYLEIVKIKRINFLNDNGLNEEVESSVNDFVSYLKSSANFNGEKLDELIVSYKNSVYQMILQTLDSISGIYLNNFVSEIKDALNASLDFNVSSNSLSEDAFRPYIPDINPVLETEIPMVPEVPIIDTIEIPQVPEIDTSQSIDINDIPEVPEELNEVQPVLPMDVAPIAPIEIIEEKKDDEVKKTYDVEEILKIAKSPVVTMPVEEKKQSEKYVSVSPIANKEENDTFDDEFNEREIVEEMINRLTKRLEVIKERQEKYDEEKRKLEEDEAFVNDLIESSNKKREELDSFEKELDDKEKEIEEKQQELDKKINDVMPFADAIMKSSNEEA